MMMLAMSERRFWSNWRTTEVIMLTLPIRQGNRKKIEVPAGKSISVQDVLTAESEQISPVGKQKSIPKKKKRKSLTPSSSSEDEPEIQLESDGESEIFSDCELDIDSGSPMTTGTKSRPTSTRVEPRASLKKAHVPVTIDDCEIDNFVIVLYNGQKYPGKITILSKENVTVECMQQRMKCWRWPERVDCHEYENGTTFSAKSTHQKF